MVRKTRGGKLLGKGAHGIAYNVGSDTEEPTFYSLLKSKPIQSFIIYSSDGFFKAYVKPQHIMLFQDYISEITGKIAKVLKPTKNAKNTEESFEEELAQNRRVVNTYGELAEKYLTVAPMKPFLGKDVIGCIVNLYTDEKIYASFSNKCDNKFTMDLDKFIIDILESIIILQTLSYRHNDIKLDNIVRCEERYKLIDWDQFAKITELDKLGTLISTSPVRWYIKGYNPIISKTIMSVKTTMRNYGFSASKIYKQVTTNINKEFDEIIGTNPDKDNLSSTYAYSFDIFMLGMTILHSVYKYKLDFDKYSSIIFKFTSLKEPVKNAIEALQFVKENT